MRILLIKPSYSNVYRWGPQTDIITPPLGLEYIAAYIKDIADVRIIDNRLETINLKVIEKAIEQYQPDYVGISWNFSSQIDIARRIAKIAKSYGCRTVVGGWHPTLVPSETLEFPSIDIVVRGEGEITFRELIQNNSPVGILGLSYKQDGKQIHNPDRELMNLKHVRPPARHFRSVLAKKTYNFFGIPVDCIETSRGCPYFCNFCSIHHFFRKKYRQHAIRDIIKELHSSEIRNRAGLIYVIDDNFVVDHKFVIDLCNAIIQSRINKYFMTQVRVDMVVNHPEVFKKMADAGFIYLFLGLESFSDGTLEKLNKQIKFKQIKSALKILHDLGFFVHGNIILGANLEDTRQDLESTIEIAKNLDVDLLTYSLLTPFPGTELWEQVLSEDLLLTRDWHQFTWSDPVIKYPYLSSDELSYFLGKSYKETMSFHRPWQGIRRLVQTRGLKYNMLRIAPIDIFKMYYQMLKNLRKILSNK
ncbi:MAG: B12-binding domain-containing radical SAM protein [Candidatus Lokiarchaeota archaeon]|nr:B12-binding domain-containing radical SAM protein [Candidatus Lokiarchaeota archaeon]